MFKWKGLLCLCVLFLSVLVAGASAQQQVRIGIMPFLSRSDEITDNQAAQIADVITRILHVSPSISVIERERLRVIAVEQGFNMGLLNQDAATKIGQLAGCQYILLGSVTQLTQRYLSSGSSLTSVLGSLYLPENQTQEATAILEARLIDVATGRVALSFSQGGSAFISSDDGKKSHSKGALAMRAVEAASSRLGDKIREILADEYAMIITVRKDNIRINRGSMSGVNVGTLYKVYEEGEEVFDLNGKSLGKRSINLAIVRVIDVRNEFSSIEILEDSAFTKPGNKKAKKTVQKDKTKTGNGPGVVKLIREGDRIEAISLLEAEKLKLNPTRR